MTITAAVRHFVALAVAAAIGLAAWGSATGPSVAPPAASQPGATASIPPGDLPADGGPATDPGVGVGGGSVGDPGTGIGVGPVDPSPIDPAVGQPTLVQPVPGRINPQPVVPTAIQASVDGRHVLVKVSWDGGVEPCSVLDSVRIERTGSDITLTLIEGSSDPTAICIEIALLKATIADLGDLEPGTWRISSPGSDVPPVVLTIA